MKQFAEVCRERLDAIERTGELTPRVVAHLRAQMERDGSSITTYAYYAHHEVCIWDEDTARHYTAQEYAEYLSASGKAGRDGAE